MEAQRDRARKSAVFTAEQEKPFITELTQQLGPTEFLGYQALQSESVVQALLKGDSLADEVVEGDDVELVLDATPFYPEGGGQVGDQGTLTGREGRIQVKETTKVGGKLLLHKGTVVAGRVRTGEPAGCHGGLDDPARRGPESYRHPSPPRGAS